MIIKEKNDSNLKKGYNYDQSNISVNDFGEIPLKDTRFYDRRSFFILLKDNLIDGHALLNLIFKISILEPYWKKIITFAFELSFMGFMISIFYTDDLVDKRQMVDEEERVKLYY